MKTPKTKILLLLSFILLLTGCKKDYMISDKQAILFQIDYVNYAWGYQHNGIMIDREGNVLEYNNPENWNFADDNLILNENAVAENISLCDLTGIKISKDDLIKYSKYINNIASSKVTALKNVAADAGSLVFLCYQYSENTHSYKGYLIKMEGDFTSENLNFYSKKVVAWLKDVKNNTSKK